MKELCEILEKAIYSHPPERITQWKPKPNEKGYCSIGARLAMTLNTLPSWEAPACLNGIDEWIKTAGGNRLHAILLLRQAGAGYYPFEGTDWQHSPEVVLANIKKIKELPSILQENFRFCDLQGIQLSKLDLSKSDFQNADFAKSKLTDINFYKTNLRGATLNNASIINCNFKEADITTIKLEGTFMLNSNLNDGLWRPSKKEKTI